MLSLFPFEETKSVNDEMSPQSKLLNSETLLTSEVLFAWEFCFVLFVNFSSYPLHHIEDIGISNAASDFV